VYRGLIPVHNVGAFYRHPMYLEAVVENVDEALSRFESPEHPEIVFSAHSIPMSIVAKGDPYQRQIEETVRLLMARGGWSNRHRLCYQSKVGASKWLQPSLHRTLRDLANESVRQVCIVPVAFVSDHVETLGEIDHEAREEARRLGITQFEMSSGLNDSPKFISALGQLVLNALEGARHSYSPIHMQGRQASPASLAAGAD
jgi:ferrochelatase